MLLKSIDPLDHCPCDGEVCLTFLDHCLLVCTRCSAHFRDHDGHHHRYHCHQSCFNWVNKTVLGEWKRHKSPGVNNWKCIQVFASTWAVPNGFQPRRWLHWTYTAIWVLPLQIQCCAIYTLHTCSGSGEASVSFHAGAHEEQIYFHPWKWWECATEAGQSWELAEWTQLPRETHAVTGSFCTICTL